MSLCESKLTFDVSALPSQRCANAEAAVPEFVPPPEDVAFIDASAVPAPMVSEQEVRALQCSPPSSCHFAVPKHYRPPRFRVQEAAEEHQRTVSAFSRHVHNPDKVARVPPSSVMQQLLCHTSPAPSTTREHVLQSSLLSRSSQR